MLTRTRLLLAVLIIAAVAQWGCASSIPKTNPGSGDIASGLPADLSGGSSAPIEAGAPAGAPVDAGAPAPAAGETALVPASGEAAPADPAAAPAAEAATPGGPVAQAPSAPASEAGAPAQSPASDVTRKYDFEDSSNQGWLIEGNSSGMWSDPNYKYAGGRSLGIHVDNISPTTHAYAAVKPDSTLGPGKTVSACVYLKGDSASVRARLYAQDSSWRWVATGDATPLKANGWTQVSAAIPANAPAPLERVGVQFLTSDGSFTGQLNVDDVGWTAGSGSVVVAPAAPQPAAPAPVAPAAPAPVTGSTSGLQKGMTLGSWWNDHYQTPAAQAALNDNANMGTQWIAMIPHWYMDNKFSTNVYADYGGGTATDASVRYFIQQAHAKGIKVMLKPHVDPRDGNWRGSIEPSNIDAWFASYKNMIVHYAKMATEEGVEQFSVGCEFQSITHTGNDARWRDVIAAVRSVYKGPLTYSANWGPAPGAEYYRITWWDALDYIGIDSYFPLTDVANPTVEQAKAGWMQWVDQMRTLTQKWGKKLIFTEIGFKSITNAGNEWMGAPLTPNMQAQANCIEATFQVMSQQPWVAGYYWWAWSIETQYGGSSDTGHWLNGKPAAQTISNWYHR